VIRLNTLDDLANLSESVDVECKLAAGADGKGRLPREFWPTYSAFANTRGGLILLGVREDSGRFTVHGVDDADRVVTDLFNTVNNPDKVSINLQADAHIRRMTVDGRTLIAVEVPSAGRKQKPVYLNGNPLRGNTYRRLHDGDRRQTRLEMDFAKAPEKTLGETRVKTLEKALEKTPEKILSLIESNPEISIAELGKCLGKSASAIERAIRKLKSQGKLKRIGPDRGGYWEVTEIHDHRARLFKSTP